MSASAVQTVPAGPHRLSFVDVAAGKLYARPSVTVWTCGGCGAPLRNRHEDCCAAPPQPRQELRFLLDFRTEARRLGIPERAARITRIPSGAGMLVLNDERLAQRALDRIRDRLAQGEPLGLILDEYRPYGATHVLSRAQMWLEDRARAVELGQRSRGWLREARRTVRQDWTYWQETPVGRITSGALDSWAAWLQAERGLAPASVVVVLRGFHAYMAWERRQGTIREVPDFPTVRVPRRRAYRMPEADQDRVLAAIPAEQRGLYLAMVDCALRGGEARALLAVDYDPELPGWLHVRRAMDDASSRYVRDTTKTGTEGRVPVSARLAAWIEAHVPAEARLERRPLFASRQGGHYCQSAIREMWRRACRRAGVQYAPVAKNRGARATHLLNRLLESGYSKTDAAVLVQGLLRHASLGTTMAHYAEVDGQALVRVMEGKKP